MGAPASWSCSTLGVEAAGFDTSWERLEAKHSDHHLLVHDHFSFWLLDADGWERTWSQDRVMVTDGRLIDELTMVGPIRYLGDRRIAELIDQFESGLIAATG